MNADALRKLYPELSEEEVRTAGERLDAYLALAWEIYREMNPILTGGLDQARIQGKVDSPPNQST